MKIIEVKTSVVGDNTNNGKAAELHGLKEMAAHTYEQRLSNLEILRKRTLNSDTRLARVITIIKGSA